MKKKKEKKKSKEGCKNLIIMDVDAFAHINKLIQVYFINNLII